MDKTAVYVALNLNFACIVTGARSCRISRQALVETCGTS